MATDHLEEVIYHYWPNHRGDVVSILNTGGIEGGPYTYGAFGNVLTQVGLVAQGNPVLYAENYFDEEIKTILASSIL